jgi:hypothetical protein
MLTAAAESELRAITSLARGCEKSHGKKQTALLFSALADRLDNFIEEHGEAAWRRRTGQSLPVIAPQ